MNGLDSLRDNELRALANAFQVGVLSQGVTPQGLRVTAPGAADEGLQQLDELAGSGWQPDQLRVLCEAVLQARKQEDRLSHIVSLVISGPEAEGVYMRDTGTIFRELVQEAEREIVCATYAIYNGRELFEDLAAKLDDDPGFEATFYLDIPRKYGDTTGSEQLVAQYRHNFVTKQWPGQRLPKLFHFVKSLELDWQQRASMHAKVVIMDGRKLFVSSANLTKAAQAKNVEMGVVMDDPRSSIRVRTYLATLAETALKKF